MSIEDTKKLGNVINNVYSKIVLNTMPALNSDEIHAAHIIATGTIVAALIREENEIYHDY